MYSLELDRLITTIKEKGAKNVMIQLPDGLKPQADDILDAIEYNTEAQGYIWFTSCYGACDIPIGLDTAGIDLFVQWGHNRFHRTNWSEDITGGDK
jgi:2-(3-amino-3-carboxypropyl)histidine synthase